MRVIIGFQFLPVPTIPRQNLMPQINSSSSITKGPFATLSLKHGLILSSVHSILSLGLSLIFSHPLFLSLFVFLSSISFLSLSFSPFLSLSPFISFSSFLILSLIQFSPPSIFGPHSFSPFLRAKNNSWEEK